MPKLFARNKKLLTSELPDGTLRCQASLDDDDQTIEVICIVTYPDLTIQEASCIMTRTPGRECLGARANVNKLVGLTIAHGYNKQVKQLLGGPSGCVHMVDLAIEIGHTAVQGKFKKMMGQQKSLTPAQRKKFWKDELKGQCRRYP
jgi:hypothetical protein